MFATCISPLSATLPSVDAWWTLHELAGRRPRSTSSAPTARKTRLFCSMRSKASISSSAMRSRAPSWMRRFERPLAGLVAALVTTLGADGAQVEIAEGRIASPGFAPKIVDTTGAGDCFAAACLHARLAARLDWRDALRFANCAAAISTTGLGAQSALPTAAQVVAYLSATPSQKLMRRRLAS